MKYGFILWALLTGNYLFAQVIPFGFIKPINTRIPTGYNPVTNNLLLYLDATRTASYGGTGTTWTDISGVSPANSATLVGGPAFSVANNNVGSFTFANNKYALTSNLISSISTNATFIAWINPSQTQTKYTGIIVSRAGFSGATVDATGLDFNENNSIGYVWKSIRDTYEWNSNIQVPNTQWSMVALTINSTKATVYLCNSSGTTRSAEKNVTHPPLSGNLKFYVGLDPATIDPDWALIGKIGTAMVYSSTLTKADIESIYNAQKAAFGL
jgi:hypothetical protein